MSEEKTTGTPTSGEDVAALLGEIGSILGDDSSATAASDDFSFEFPSDELLRYLPERYLRDAHADHAGETILLTLDDLYEQLARGKITLTVSQLAYFLPMHIIYQAALDDKSEIELPLPVVVDSVGVDKLERHTPGEVRDYGIDDMDDIFKKADAVAYSGPEDDDDDDSPVVLFGESEDEEPVADAEAKPAAEEESAEEESPQPEEKTPAEPEEVTEPEPEEAQEEIEKEVEEEAEEEAAAQDEPVEAPVVAEAEAVAQGDDVKDSFEYPALLIAKLLPEAWLTENFEKVLGDSKLTIVTPDLMQQLKTGKFTMACNLLAIQLPPEVLTSEVSHQDSPMADLDLKIIVESMGIDLFASDAPDLTQKYEIDWMKDPFKKPDVLPPLVRKKKPVKTPEIPTAIRSEESLEQKEVPYVAEDEDGPESEYHELPGNVNINAATVDELMKLDGMTKAIAEEIVAFRDEHKRGFKTIYQLHKIAGVDDAVFEKLTGIQPGMKRFHRRRRLVNYLKIPAKRVSDLSLVARTMSEKANFRASIISDHDGLVLAQYGLGESGYDISAVLPRITDQLKYNLDLVDIGNLDSITLRVDGDFYTIVPLENVTLTIVHDENQITRQGLELIEKVAEELSWLLSVRAYVGPYITED